MYKCWYETLDDNKIMGVFKNTRKEYEKVFEDGIIELDTYKGKLSFDINKVRLVSLIEINRKERYDECITKIDEFEGNSTFDELLEENNNNLESAIYNLKLILDRCLEESETTEQIEFYTSMLSKVNSINTIE